ncbi:hypothetical protein B0H16DRAFT_601392 [Mycena metata]|uniref:Uncharacterized protein n=1 Tax=Mycena metata TaxID=1033252 RepID=A0AAD7K945_9AGAR|nr:hypothetical protein B0H16DRAFT_601392 [Mycena metata]
MNRSRSRTAPPSTLSNVSVLYEETIRVKFSVPSPAHQNLQQRRNYLESNTSALVQQHFAQPTAVPLPVKAQAIGVNTPAQTTNLTEWPDMKYRASPAATPGPAQLNLDTMQILIGRIQKLETEVNSLQKLETKVAKVHTFIFPLAARALLDTAVNCIGEGLSVKPRPGRIRGEQTWDPAIVHRAIQQTLESNTPPPHGASIRTENTIKLIQNPELMALLFDKEDGAFGKQLRAAGDAAAHSYDDEAFREYCSVTHLASDHQTLLQLIYNFITPDAKVLKFASM